jgi:hypothetical protein
MKTLKCILIALSLLQLNCYAFHSVQEVLDFETAQIANVGSADSYINRAESFLLCQKYYLALDDLEIGNQLAKDQSTMLLRSLFGLAIVYANIDKLQEFYVVVNSIEQLLDAHKCVECATLDSKELCFYILEKSLLSKNKPDRISIEECIEKANNTANYARILINKSHPAAKLVLNALVNRLTNKAIKCCAAGGLWRDCIHPLATKWLEWSEKWKVFK